MRRKIRNGTIINEGVASRGDILIEDDIILEIAPVIDTPADEEIEAEGCFVIPGVIDDHLHLREPGLTHKEDIASGSRAAVAGGVTSFMDMPNVIPPTTTMEQIERKREIAAESSLANYSFYLGATSENIEEIKRVDPHTVCGVKLFMGASTGNMLIETPERLSAIFAESPILVAVHCEDTPTINENLAHYEKIYGEDIPIHLHPEIRSREACIKSSSLAVALAHKYGTRLHLLHLSTKEEAAMLRVIPQSHERSEKKITGEACVHHLFFNDTYYERLGSYIRWNPAIKSEEDRTALIAALNDKTIDLIGTDHAPHTREEKRGPYKKVAGGGPLVQHSLIMMLELTERGEMTKERVIDAMCHAPADLFGIEKRGYLRPGYKADIAIFKKESWVVSPENILYKCGWSPLEGMEFSYRVLHTIVNGRSIYRDGSICDSPHSEMLTFSR